MPHVSLRSEEPAVSQSVVMKKYSRRYGWSDTKTFGQTLIVNAWEAALMMRSRIPASTVGWKDHHMVTKPISARVTSNDTDSWSPHATASDAEQATGRRVGVSRMKAVVRRLLCCSPMLAAIGFHSCASLDQTAVVDPFLGAPAAAFPETDVRPPAVVNNAPVEEHPRNQYIHQTAFEQSVEPMPSAAPVANQAAETIPAERTSATDSALIFKPAEPRQPFLNVSGSKEGESQGVVRSTDALDFPDEYLWNGGDQPARTFPDNAETLAEYTDHTGKRHQRGSNQVAIYAPRFGSIRSISSPEGGVAIEKVASSYDTARGAGLRNRVGPTSHGQREGLEQTRMRSRVSGLESETLRSSVTQSIQIAGHIQLQYLYQGLGFLKTGEFDQSERAHIASRLESAIAWTRDQNPLIFATDAAANEVYATFKLEEMVGLEEKNTTTGKIRIVKLADRQSALPGDVITFTIRYDNLGDRELSQVRIVDNLTPRLEFIKDSAVSDKDGQIVVEDNGAGSSVILFELDGPLEGKSGGVISFKALVR